MRSTSLSNFYSGPVRAFQALLVVVAMLTAAQLPAQTAPLKDTGQTLYFEGGALVTEAIDRYYVIFNEPGAFSYRGGDARFAATASPREGLRFDANRVEVESYRVHLQSLQSERIASFEQRLGRSLAVNYRYDVVFSGIVVEGITASEAAALARQPNVARVEIVRDYELATDRGPQFIGADTIWAGSTTPSAAGFRGEGIVIGVIDTGLNLDHPAFQNDASCGHDADNPKVVAARDCINSGTCTGASPGDSNDHGSHVAGTALGTTHIATGGALAGTQVSGVAPCASLISYKVCPDQSCDGAAITAAINTALIDGIDALNYSITGGQNPWSDVNAGFLDLVNNGTFVAASAGNTRESIPNPIGNVNHRGPWVMTVANSTHDRVSSNAVNFDQGGPQNMYGVKGHMTIGANVVGQIADAATTDNPLGCNASGGFPAGSMTARIALISRGDCTFAEKLTNAANAGAIGGIIFNNNPGQPPIVMGATETSIPAVMTSNADGLAIRAHVAANPTTQATISSTTVVTTDPAVGDILAASSLRGPIGGGIEVAKPDIAGPGSNIFAPGAGGATSYIFASGTSMSSPHIAGGAALVMGVQPNWTVTEVKSAIQLTASKTGSKDFVNGDPNSGNWDADDVGSGRIDLSKAALAGLVMHETGANFLAANANQPNQRALNLPSMRHSDCSPSCTFTRTVRNTLGVPTQWNAAGVTISPGLSVNVSPSSFSLNGDTSETQVLTVTVQPDGDQTARFIFGELVLTEANDESPELHMTVAIRGTGPGSPPRIAVDPTSITATGNAGFPHAVTRPLNILNNGGIDLDWSITTVAADPTGDVTVLWDQPQDGSSAIVSSFSVTQNGGAYTAGAFRLVADATLTSIFTPGTDSGNLLGSSPGITWQIYRSVNDEPEGNPQTNPDVAVWSYTAGPSDPGVSFTGSGVLTLSLVAAEEDLELDEGSYWLTVFPTYTGNITTSTDPRWTWFQAQPVGVGSKLIAPTLFGNIPNWRLTGTGGLGTAIQDVAFTLSGIQGSIECGAPWLSASPESGIVSSGGTGATTLSLNAAALTEGVYAANLCISSNDPANDFVVVPVAFTVGPALAASQVVIITQPSSAAQSGEAFAQQPVVELQDANGNPVLSAGTNVTAAIASGEGDLTGTTTVPTDVNGQATFTDLAITGSVGDRTLSFSSDTLTAATSDTISLSAGAASTLATLNDTGQTQCVEYDANDNASLVACTQANTGDESSHPRQDGRFGRDAQAGAGAAGFDFTRICNSGQAAGSGTCPAVPALGSEPDQWACTRDNVTGLIWEVKVNDSDQLRHTNHLYTWFDGTDGSVGTDTCNGTLSAYSNQCNIDNYRLAVNAVELCGFNDWRVPTLRELLSIVHHGTSNPAIDTTFFPNTQIFVYWSSDVFASNPTVAWEVYFVTGDTNVSSRTIGIRVRLVRSGQ